MAKAKKLPSGTWRCIASFTDEDGKYKQKSFTAPTKKEAEYNFPYNFHSLRHYFASVMVKAGIPNKYAAEFMGYTTENMLQRVYQHTFQEDKARFATMMAQKMNELGKE